MDRTALVIAGLVVLAVVPSGGVAGEGGAPLADAGLDQHAEVGETVLLDATGSRDPGGGIEAYEWKIETPGGETVTPADPSDPRTRFVVHKPGRYDVTITVTDESGRSSSDTLYVYVEGSGGSDAGADDAGHTPPSGTSTPQSSESPSFTPDHWYSSWDTPSDAPADAPSVPPTVPRSPYLRPGEKNGPLGPSTKDFGGSGWIPGNPSSFDPPMDLSKTHGTLELKGSDLTYKEDVVSSSYAVNENLAGLEMGDGESPGNEIVEGIEGIKNGLVQAVVGTEAKTMEYKVSGETAREIQGIADYSTGKHEDELSEQMNTRSDAPAVKEDYVLNDARVLDGVRESADVVEVTVHVAETKGLTDYAASGVGTGVNIAGKTANTAAKSATSTITDTGNQVMNYLGGSNG